MSTGTTPQSQGLAYSGSRPGRYPQTSIFDFVFGNPFETQSDYVPASSTVPRIDDGHSIFIDHKTSKLSQY